MNTIPPRIPEDLKPIESFAAYVQAFLQEDDTIEGIRCGREQCADADFYKLDMRTSVFENCTFHGCNFEKAGFIDVEFRGCDLSNCKFHGAYFERCKFVSCKLVGADMVGAMIKQTAFEDVLLRYANFNTVKINGVLFDRVDFTDASMAEAKQKRFSARETKFIRNDFSKTMLTGVDFSDSVLAAPVVSNPPAELKGIIIDMFQAADLVGIWGIRVKR